MTLLNQTFADIMVRSRTGNESYLRLVDVASGPVDLLELQQAKIEVARSFDVTRDEAEAMIACAYICYLRGQLDDLIATADTVRSKALSWPRFDLWLRLLAAEHRKMHVVCGRCGSHDVTHDLYVDAKGYREPTRHRLNPPRPAFCRRCGADSPFAFYEVYA